jgi:DUF1365 family protein
VRSGLYPGVVAHARLRPRAHRLRYRVFMLLLDLDEAATLDRGLRLFSLGGFSLTAFHPADHGDGSDRPLKAQVEARLAAAGLASGGPVLALSMPRILGGAFNPLTVYFCHDRAGALSAILYEVNNTFGERHEYLLPATDGEMVRQACRKAFHVSPFMDMDLDYAFEVRPPGAAVSVVVAVSDAAGLVLSTSFAGRRGELSDRALLRAWLTHPWMTLGVLTAIGWEAVKIRLKGERWRPRPAAHAGRRTRTPASIA